MVSRASYNGQRSHDNVDARMGTVNMFTGPSRPMRAGGQEVPDEFAIAPEWRVDEKAWDTSPTTETLSPNVQTHQTHQELAARNEAARKRLFALYVRGKYSVLGVGT